MEILTMFLRNRILLLSSVAVTVLLLVNIGIVSHDAMTIREAEEIEEDTSELLLHSERWLNHQETIEVALRDYVLFGKKQSLQTIETMRQESEEHVLGMKKALGEYQEDAGSRILGLLKYKDRHQRLVDEIIQLKRSGDTSNAYALLASTQFNVYMPGANFIIDKITQDLQDRRSKYNSVVSLNVLRGSISFAAMGVLMISAVWIGFVINLGTQRRNEELSTKLAFEATHDALTGLPNRRYMHDHLNHAFEMATRHHLRMALMIIDLDGFKSINDTYGHDAGDLVLVEVANRFKQLSRTSDFIVRTGGDEFALIAEHVKQPISLHNLAQRLIDCLDEPVEFHGREKVSVGCSIGIAIYPDHAEGLDSLFAAADRAMYESKAGGRNQWRMA
jgi:diguanylate cyclase (GGDEF)-like protein